MIHEDENGQATVEFALVLPLVLVCLALVLQTLVIASAQITVHHQAQLAARAASMSATPAATAHSMVHDQRTNVDVTVTDILVTVALRRNVSIMVPLVRRFLPSIDVRSSLTMALEPPIDTHDGPQRG